MNKPQLVSYELVEPGFEAMYGRTGAPFQKSVMKDGKAAAEWCVWQSEEGLREQWLPERKYINQLQQKLGHLDDGTRMIRAYVPSIEVCDSGFPLTVEEALRAIGANQLTQPSFRAGCRNDVWWKQKGTQPRQVESMRMVHSTLRGILDARGEEELIQEHPFARGFILRTYEWFHSGKELNDLQRLLIKRMLIGFGMWDHLSRTLDKDWTDEDRKFVDKILDEMHQPTGRGSQIDKEIDSCLDDMKDMTEEQDKSWRQIRQSIAAGIHGVSDCHHSSFRRVECWIHAIATGKQTVPNRKQGSERQRLARTSFAYILALDRWLLGVPMQFLLLDLGHTDPGLDPRNEILRTYALLGDQRTNVKE